MKSQSIKLFAVIFVLGLVAIFGAGSASAQEKLAFETSFDFQVGKEKLSAGKYELKKMSFGKYLLRNAETKSTRVVTFDISAKNTSSSEAERVVFNRYGETYFLSGIFDRRDADGKQVSASGYEKKIRRETIAKGNRSADEKTEPVKVAVKLSK